MKLGNQKNKERTSIITLLPLLGADVSVISQKKPKLFCNTQDWQNYSEVALAKWYMLDSNYTILFLDTLNTVIQRQKKKKKTTI